MPTARFAGRLQFRAGIGARRRQSAQVKSSFRWSVVRGSLAATFAAAIALVSSLPAYAAGDTLDQAQTLTIGLQRQIPMLAQTFTAGMSGKLDRVSLAYDTSSTTNLRVSIQTTGANGAPSGTAIAGPVAWQGTVGCCRQFHDFSFGQGVSIAAGTKYAIVVQTISGVFTWYSDSTIDAYTGGQLYVGSSWLTGPQWGDDFAFKTWVAASANSAPTLTADNAAVSVGEGTAPVNTGAYSDPDGDTVAFSASTGTVTHTGTSSGTWSWTQGPSDEAPAQAVTISASDGQGHVTTASFSVTVTTVAPTAQITSDPIEGPEGSAVPFTGAGSSPAAADNSTLVYKWTVTKNGSSYASGAGTSFSFTPDDEGTFVVTFTVSDDGGMSGTDSATVIGTNVAPSARISGVAASAPLVVAPFESLTFSGSFSDAGALDSHTVTWNFGDGATASASYGAGGSATFSTSHAYSTPGTYNVTLTVSDDDGGVGQSTTRVTVQTVAQALNSVAGYVQGISTLNAGQKNSLVAKLNAASAAAARGNDNAASNQLDAFLNEVQADVNTGKISSAQAATLRNAVHAVKAALGTYNRFLEWWPLAA
jgi:hypothetical protein